MDKRIELKLILWAEDGYNDDENIEDVKKSIERFIEDITGFYIEEFTLE